MASVSGIIAAPSGRNAAALRQGVINETLSMLVQCGRPVLHAVTWIFAPMAELTQHHVLRRETDIAHIASPVIRAVDGYWRGKRGMRAMPAWSDIDPAELVKLLPNLIVVAIEPEPFRVRYRLVGTKIVEFRGEVTGLYLDSIPWTTPAAKEKVQESFARVVASRQPLFAEVDVGTRTGVLYRTYAGVWPLAPQDDAPIDRCLAAEDYGDLTRADLG
jgi:hypothetical protein